MVYKLVSKTKKQNFKTAQINNSLDSNNLLCNCHKLHSSGGVGVEGIFLYLTLYKW